MSATTEVGEVVDAIQSSTSRNIDKLQQAVNAGDTLRERVEILSQTADQARSIAIAAEQQSSASKELKRISGEISQMMLESSMAAQKVADLARQLDGVIQDMQQE